MLKLLLWKCGFEIANLRRILHPARSTTSSSYYFAFGANLDPQVLKKRKIVPLEEREFVLNNFEIKFDHPGAWQGMGYASAQAAPNKKIYGKLYRLDAIDAQRLDYFESVYFIKRYKKVFVTQESWYFYFYQSAMPRLGLRPNALYRQKIIDGLQHLQSVPTEYLEQMRHTPITESTAIATDLNFYFKPHRWLPEKLRQYLDQKMLVFYAFYWREISLTERFIK